MTALIAAVVFLVAVIGCAGAFGLALLLDRADTYPPEAADAPDEVERGEILTTDEHGYLRATPWVGGAHPQDCADTCCYGARLDELVAAYDWDAAEKDIVRPWKGQAR